MQPLLDFLSTHGIISLFAILCLGVAFGELGIKGISLGTSGVFFVALVFGHFGITIPGDIQTLGVVLFVYAIGLSAGPRFFAAFQRRGLTFATLALAIVGTGFLAAAAMEFLFHFGAPLATGMFTGALTSTPGLAAAQESLASPNVSVGYGIAYPIGVVAVVLFVQLLPRILRIDLRREEAHGAHGFHSPALTTAWFEVRNPQLDGRTVDEFTSAHLFEFTLSRISKGDRAIPALGDAVLALGDRVRVVGSAANLAKLEYLIGPRVLEMAEPPSSIASRTLVVSEDEITGKRLSELQIRERYGVVVTRLFRDEIELVPKWNSTLEIGDTIRIVGDAADCERFAPLVGVSERRQHETAFLPVLTGLVLGAFLGLVPFNVGGITVKLGMAGGPLFVGVLLGHFGRLGRMRVRMPLAARYFIRELGLILFLAGAGASAGTHFVPVFKTQGVSILFAGAVVTIVPMLVAYAMARRMFKLDILSTLGLITGGMTCTPGLGAIQTVTDSETPAVAYATVYPVALIFVTVLAQLLAFVLKALGA